MRRELLTVTRVSAVTGPAIGAPYLGGYYAGIIDTTKGNIDAGDFYQVGVRYELIICAKVVESATGVQYKLATTLSPPESHTRWNGLAATAALVAATGHPAADYANALSYPADGASPWYLPAMDEGELLYRNFKQTTVVNNTSSTTGTFPAGPQFPGVNPSSDPAGAAYTTTVPGQTTVTAFKNGGSQAFPYTTSSMLWNVTENGVTTAWATNVGSSGTGKFQSLTKTSVTGTFVRAVRRRVLT